MVSVLDTAVGIRGPSWLLSELAPLLEDLPTGRAPSRVLAFEMQPSGRLRLLDEGMVVASDIAPAVATATAVWRCNSIAAASREHIVIHAASIGGDGAVLLPAESGAGKSTLAAGCVRAGMTYLSDEYAVIDPGRGCIVPYAKPLSLEGETLVAASHLRPNSLASTLFPAGIIFPRYVEGAATSATALSSAATLLLLARNTVQLTSRRGSALAWLAGLASSCPAWRYVYGTVADVQARARAVGSHPAAALRPAETIGPVTPTTTTVVLGDELAVLALDTGEVHVLNSSAALVWSSVPDAVERRELEELVVARATGALARTEIRTTIEHLAALALLPSRF